MSKHTIFKNYTFTWWQIGILKTSLLFIGLAAGAKWPAFFAEYILILFVLGVIGGLYMKYQGFKQ
jgi:hypothetical protein